MASSTQCGQGPSKDPKLKRAFAEASAAVPHPPAVSDPNPLKAPSRRKSRQGERLSAGMLAGLLFKHQQHFLGVLKSKQYKGLQWVDTHGCMFVSHCKRGPSVLELSRSSSV